MPSLKACLASLALMALAFAPIDAATSTRAGLAARNGAGVARRNAAAKALAKRAARLTFAQEKAAKAKAAAAAASSKAAASSSSSAAAAEATANVGPYSPNSAFMNTKIAIAAGKLRCGTATVCERRAPTPPTNGYATCVSGKCVYRCDQGYAPGGSDGTQCVANADTCGGVTCQVPTNGYATCNSSNECEIGCQDGYTRYTTDSTGGSAGTYGCFATSSDPENCGTPGNVCPDSYNGIGTPACKSSTCRIQCPAGSFLRRANSVDYPYYCYSGLSSLCSNGGPCDASA